MRAHDDKVNTIMIVPRFDKRYRDEYLPWVNNQLRKWYDNWAVEGLQLNETSLALTQIFMLLSQVFPALSFQVSHSRVEFMTSNPIY